MRKVRSTRGILSHADLENYRVKVEPALEGLYRGRRVLTTKAPSSGPGKVVLDTGLFGDSSRISVAPHVKYNRAF